MEENFILWREKFMLTNKKWSNLTQILWISAAVIIGAQIYFNLFNSDFRISIGIFVFSISVILFGEYPIIPVTYLSAVGVLASRTLLHSFRKWYSIWFTDFSFIPIAAKKIMNCRLQHLLSCFSATFFPTLSKRCSVREFPDLHWIYT